jgi:FHS family L-fucose permease-like MFS transporter
MTISASNTAGSGGRRFGFVLLVQLFFLWGFMTALNDILLPYLKSLFDLSFLEAGLVQFCFFAAYGIMGIPSGLLLERLGHQKGIVVALAIMAFGCILFLPAARILSYPLFLLALFVLASGIVVLQTAANPFVTLLGTPETAASRLNLSQGFNSLGHTLGPQFGAYLLLRNMEGLEGAAVAQAVRTPYILLAALLVLLSILFAVVQLPKPNMDEVPDPSGDGGSAKAASHSIWSHASFRFGVPAIFLYVGAEVAVGSYLVDYFGTERLGSLDKETAGYLISWYWGSAMVGRFLGAALMQRIKAQHILAFNGVMAILLLLVSMSTVGLTARVAVLGVGLFNSVMFPSIFSLSVAGLGSQTHRGSGYLIMAIVGGAFLPALQGLTADQIGLTLSFVVPAFGYAYIAWYGARGARHAVA